MPKIKLSALISDIKGKSNGSVFSKNKSGVYFRNNPSGGGKKSAKWDRQKSILGSLASQWKDLSTAQKEAWNDAVTSYQTTNAFGDIRIPSGYELFMRLNGSLLSSRKTSAGCEGDDECNYGYMCIGGECQPVSVERLGGFPAIKTPLAPRAIPDMGTVQLEYPDLFQLNPNKKLLLSDPTNSNAWTNLIFTQTVDAHSVFGEQSHCFRFELTEKQANTILTGEEYPLYSFIDNNNYGWVVYLKYITNSTFVLATNIHTSDGDVLFETLINQNLYSQPFHVLISSTTSEYTGIKVYVNGSFAASTANVTDSPTDESRNYQVRIGNVSGMPVINVFYSDYRMYVSALTTDEILLISLGYVLNTEFLLTDCITNTNNNFKNFGLFAPEDTFNIIAPNPNFKYLYSASFFLIPKLSFTVENQGMPGLYLNVYATPPISYGKTGTQTNLKLLATFLWDTNTTFDFAPYYKSVYASLPPNSQVQLYVSYLDSTTGVQPATKKKGNGKNVRFKAGADLTDKVN
jgi:hypothetical protein